MPAFKRKRYTKPASTKVKRRTLKKPRLNIKRMVQAVVNRNLETKMSVISNSDGVEILHNNFIVLDTALLKTTPGVLDPMNKDVMNRIGDEVMCKGVSLKFMFELNERYSDVTLRVMVIKSARGDEPTRATLFSGISGNKMLDTINKERYTVIGEKWVKMRAPNNGTIGGPIPGGTGFNQAGNNNFMLSRGSKIVKMWLPSGKFARNGKLLYENDGTNVKFLYYRVVVYAYSNFSTQQDIFVVARVNDYIKQMYCKDA